jgi:hypothetical protein
MQKAEGGRQKAEWGGRGEGREGELCSTPATPRGSRGSGTSSTQFQTWRQGAKGRWAPTGQRAQHGHDAR